jgi:transposase-like protein
MSSSRRKKRFPEENPTLECPQCGKLSMIKMQGSTVLQGGTRVHNISRWVCQNCKEEAFDSVAMKEIARQRAIKSLAA